MFPDNQPDINFILKKLANQKIMENNFMNTMDF